MREYSSLEVVERVLSALKCDKCGASAHEGSTEFHEFVKIDIFAGYGSVLDEGRGDGCDYEVDLCQRCVRDLLGPHMRLIRDRFGTGHC